MSNLHAKFHGAIFRRIVSALRFERDLQRRPPLCSTEYILCIVVQLLSWLMLERCSDEEFAMNVGVGGQR